LSDSARKNRKEAAVKSRATALARAQQYKKEYQAEDKLNNDNRRKAKAQGGFYVQPEHKVLLVVRIRG
jgi:large subunit ribosomal protein L7e